MQTHDIQLYGHSLKLKTEHSQEIVESFKSEIEEKIDAIKKNHTQISLEKALFLTCLCLSEDRYLLKKAIHQNLDRIESQAKNVLEGLESSSQGIRLESEQNL